MWRGRIAAASSRPRSTTRPDSPDREQDPVDDRLWPWRAAGDEDVDGEDRADAAGARVAAANDAARRRAGADGDHDARLGDGLPRAPDRELEVPRHGSRDEDAVRVARRGDDVAPEAAHVVHGVEERGQLPVAGVARP